uniref:Uncharacterized protein n=2 Tax=Caenorhabditis japonica TaxID=281687 RepID=A0A8R1ENQ7_CAEJA
VIDMRNQEGLNCVDMAVRAGSELCAMLITKIAREYAKHKPRPKLENVLVSDVDLEDELDKKNVEQLDDNYLKNLVRDSATTSCHAKKLSRDKISNSLSKSAVGHDYLRMVKRSR